MDLGELAEGFGGGGAARGWEEGGQPGNGATGQRGKAEQREKRQRKKRALLLFLVSVSVCGSGPVRSGAVRSGPVRLVLAKRGPLPKAAPVKLLFVDTHTRLSFPMSDGSGSKHLTDGQN